MRFFFFDTVPANKAILTTLNGADKASTVVLSSDGLSVSYPTGNSGESSSIRGTRYARGKVVYEVTNTGAADNYMDFGLANSSVPLGPSINIYPGQTSGSIIVSCGRGEVVFGGALVDDIVPVGTGGILPGEKVMVILDPVARRVWHRYKNVNYPLGSNPEAGTGGINISALTGNIFPYIGLDVAESAAVNFGHTVFTNDVPFGFAAWDEAEDILTTWSTTDKASFINVSADGLSITDTNVNFDYVEVRATRYATGKAFFEVTLGGTSVVGTAFGLANASAPLGPALVGGGADNNSILVFPPNAPIVINNVTVASAGSNTNQIVLGAKVMVIVDPTTRRLWFRRGNVDYPLGSDPVAGTGGIDISALTGNIFPYAELSDSVNGLTANFGHTIFSNDVPAGFLEWDNASAVVDTTAPLVTSSATVSNAENSVLAHGLTANETVTWSIRTDAQNAPSVDYTHFELSGSTLRWAANGTKDFEAPGDKGQNNIYEVVVRATDMAGNFSDQTVTVTVTDIAENRKAPRWSFWL